MANRFTQKAQNSLKRAYSLAEELGHTYIGSEHILLSLVSEKDSISAKMLSSHGADFGMLRDKLAETAGTGEPYPILSSDMTPKAKKIIEASAAESGKGSSYIGTEHILLALLNERECSAVKLLEVCGVSVCDVRNDVTSYISSSERSSVNLRNGKKEDTSAISGAPALSLYGRDLTALASCGKLDTIVGRESETEHVIRVLSRRIKNNPCLVGEPGVGKTAVVEGLAQRIISGRVPDDLRRKRIITLDVSAMIAGAKYRGEFEERMKNVMDDVLKNPDIILFIDEFHMIVGAGAAEGALDAANILKPALARGELRMIGATTISEYRSHIEKDAALERRFQPVTVNEPTEEQTLDILRGLRPKYEEHHRLKISDEALDAAVKLSVRYIPDRFLPDKAIDLIDEASSKLKISYSPSDISAETSDIKTTELSRKKEEAILAQDFTLAAKLRDKENELRRDAVKVRSEENNAIVPQALTVSASDIAEIVTAWTSIPVNRLIQEESERLLRLEDTLKASVIGQDSAAEKLARAVRRGRTGLRDPRRPIGSFIFLGKTGVGKTELSRALAEAMFGSPDALIRLDMSEYMEKHSVSKLIGSPPGYVGYGEGGQLTEKIRRRPYSVLLLDEIEKAHSDVFNLLLSVLEDGVLTDSTGRRIDFKNTVIIMTSNVGASYRRAVSLGFSSASEVKSLDYSSRITDELKERFSPEFLNRIDDIIVFEPLSKKDIEKIAAAMLSKLADRGKALGFSLSFDDDTASYFAEYAYDETFGARSVRRAIVHEIEDKLSSLILEGRISQGDEIKISMETQNLAFFKNGVKI